MLHSMTFDFPGLGGLNYYGLCPLYCFALVAFVCVFYGAFKIVILQFYNFLQVNFMGSYLILTCK